MKRTRGEDAWQFRFYETTKEGQRQRRARMMARLQSTPLEQMFYALSSHFGTDLT
jgi:hypothetical protein